MSDKIIMYSTSWCPDCHRAKKVLGELQVDYVEIDIDKHKDAVPIVLHINDGKRTIPTIVFPDGSTLTEPSNKVLADKVRRT